MTRKLEDQSDAELKAQMEQLRESAAQHRNVAQSKEELADDIEDELETRQWNSIFQTNPLLTQFDKGDKLAITQAAIQEVNKPERNWSEGSIALFARSFEPSVIRLFGDGVLISWGSASQTILPIEIVSDMRRVYLHPAR